MRRALMVASLLIPALAAGAAADRCSGCGCKGGPGYRGPNGRCVGWSELAKVCGSPPTTSCKAEIADPSAHEAAKFGVKALDARRPHAEGR